MRSRLSVSYKLLQISSFLLAGNRQDFSLYCPSRAGILRARKPAGLSLASPDLGQVNLLLVLVEWNRDCLCQQQCRGKAASQWHVLDGMHLLHTKHPLDAPQGVCLWPKCWTGLECCRGKGGVPKSAMDPCGARLSTLQHSWGCSSSSWGTDESKDTD